METSHVARFREWVRSGSPSGRGRLFSHPPFERSSMGPARPRLVKDPDRRRICSPNDPQAVPPAGGRIGRKVCLRVLSRGHEIASVGRHRYAPFETLHLPSMQKQSFMNAEDFSATSLNKTKRSSPSATTSSQKPRKTTRFDEHFPASHSEKQSRGEKSTASVSPRRS